MKRIYYYPILLICVVIIVVLGWYCLFTPVTTIILVRHAERLNSTDTTSLSTEGFGRAVTLGRSVGSTGIGYIIVSEKQRTQQTAAPTAASVGVTPVEIPSSDIGRVVDSIDAHKEEIILVVGHSDTVPLIISDLGISPPPTISPNEFDRLFIVTKFHWRTTLLSLRYGNPT
ncbi:MAG: histidine phosphatase family protein [Ignavibacteria bacterium]|nr:histidine phosphatase family protein [Ignavibacteria bacterium]